MAYRKKSPQEKLEEIRAQKEALRAQFDEKLKRVDADLRAQQAKIREENEKLRVHINIIIGAAVQAHAEIDPEWKKQLWAVLNKAVKRKDQRETLDLPPLPDPE